MIRHTILYTLKSEYSPAEKNTIKQTAKTELEGLVGIIPGLLDLKVTICPIARSNADLMLDSFFENEDALLGYMTHPAHVRVADTYLRPFTDLRLCMDTESDNR